MQLKRGDRRSVATVEQLTSGTLLTQLTSLRGQLTKSDWKITESHQSKKSSLHCGLQQQKEARKTPENKVRG